MKGGEIKLFLVKTDTAAQAFKSEYAVYTVHFLWHMDEQLRQAEVRGHGQDLCYTPSMFVCLVALIHSEEGLGVE